MKKMILLAAFALGMTVYAQDSTATSAVDKKHEVRVGAVKLLAGPILEGTYEYLHRDEFTFGTSVLYSFIDTDDYTEKFSITPFARLYFGRSEKYESQGFFVEGFAKYMTGETYDYNGYEYMLSELRDETSDYSAGALGLALGGKWTNRMGIVFEILGGAGRVIGGGNNAPEAVFRGDFSLGYRF